MNGKKAKAIRALARSATVGKPERQYQIQKDSRLPNFRNIRLHGQSTRRTYQAMKHRYRRIHLGQNLATHHWELPRVG